MKVRNIKTRKWLLIKKGGTACRSTPYLRKFPTRVIKFDPDDLQTKLVAVRGKLMTMLDGMIANRIIGGRIDREFFSGPIGRHYLAGYDSNGVPARVVAAAVVADDGSVVSLPPPARHHTIILHMVNTIGWPWPITGEQGFILSNGNYVDRVMARQCAEANGQLLIGAAAHRELFSEDVW